MSKTEVKTKYLFGLLLASVLVASLLPVRPGEAQAQPEVSVVQTSGAHQGHRAGLVRQ